jgi:hypothetical protein
MDWISIILAILWLPCVVKQTSNMPPKDVPSELWDVLVSIKANTAATLLRVDHVETKVDGSMKDNLILMI